MHRGVVGPAVLLGREGEDTIRLENGVFTALPNGTLAASAFHAAAGATGEIVLLCRQAQDDGSSGRSGVDVRPGEGRLKPLVDRPDRHATGQGGDQFFF